MHSNSLPVRRPHPQFHLETSPDRHPDPSNPNPPASHSTSTAPTSTSASSPSSSTHSSTHSSARSSFWDASDLARAAQRRDSLDHSAESRRESVTSLSSWASMDPASNPQLATDDDVQEPPGKKQARRDPPPKAGSFDSIESVSSSSAVDITTPDMSATTGSPSDHVLFSTPPIESPMEAEPPVNISPVGSTISSAHSKGENTPRAEIQQPAWPLSYTGESSTSTFRSHHAATDPTFQLRGAGLARDASWRRKHASLDSPATVPNPSAALHSFTTGLRDTPPLSPYAEEPRSRLKATTPPALSDSRFVALPDRRMSLGAMATEGNRVTGNFLGGSSLPIILDRSSTTSTGVFDTPRSSGASSSSSGSSKAGSSAKAPAPKREEKELSPPRWAMPTKMANSISGNPRAIQEAQAEHVDFDVELFKGENDEWVDIIKGERGRIAVKSTPAMYEVMVWLPGMSLDGIMVVTRKTHVLHISADDWDGADHPQWDIRLGEDAVMSMIRATFNNHVLTVVAPREPKPTRPVSFRSLGTSSSLNRHGKPVITEGKGLESPGSKSAETRSMTSASSGSYFDDVEARMNRGMEGR